LLVGSYLFLDCDSLYGKLPDLLTNIAFLSSKKMYIVQQRLLFLQQYFFGSHKTVIAKRLLTVSIVRANLLTGKAEPSPGRLDSSSASVPILFS
jgi:hypothetical protein